MDAFSWFWLAVIVTIITIGVNGTLCSYWKYKYNSKQHTPEQQNSTINKETDQRNVVRGFSKKQ